MKRRKKKKEEEKKGEEKKKEEEQEEEEVAGRDEREERHVDDSTWRPLGCVLHHTAKYMPRPFPISHTHSRSSFHHEPRGANEWSSL